MIYPHDKHKVFVDLSGWVQPCHTIFETYHSYLATAIFK